MFKKILLFFLLSLSFTLSAAQKINGAGATFPYPLYSKWFSEYQKIKKDIEFNYQSIGSGGGVKQVLAQTVAFGASDVPMTEAELKSAKTPIQQIPTCLGAVAVVYNLKGIENNLKLDGETLANIFQGKIAKWNDPAISKLNPKLKLPASDILVARRSDGSGTTAVFTEFLSMVSADWKAKIGAGKNINWPTGLGAKGNEGVTSIVSQTDGAIGYTELEYAVKNKLNTVALKNAKGDFVAPNVESITKAANIVKDVKTSFVFNVINSAEKNAYPISSFTYLLIPQNAAEKEVKAFLLWALKDGSKMAAELNYAPLPKKLSDAIIKTLK